jgi:hypothetical protein
MMTTRFDQAAPADCDIAPGAYLDRKLLNGPGLGLLGPGACPETGARSENPAPGLILGLRSRGLIDMAPLSRL